MKMIKRLIPIVAVGITMVTSSFTVNVFADEFGYGDVNKDGKVSVVDAVLVQKSVLKTKDLDFDQMRLADVDGNGRVTSTDIIIIQRYIAGLINEFPVNGGSIITTEPVTQEPTEVVTQAPTQKPTEVVTQAPTQKPTEVVTQAPTQKPTEKPTEAPTEKPTEKPTQAPTEKPTVTFDNEGYLNIVYKP